MNLQKINSPEEFQELFRNAKREKGSILTNIYPGQTVCQTAVDECRLFFTVRDSELFFFEEKKGFFNIFFAVSRDADVISLLNDIKRDEGIAVPMVTELVVRTGKDQSLGSPSAVLKRMMHVGDLKRHEASASQAEGRELTEIKMADEYDIETVSEIFRNHFNPLTERIPDEKELRSLIENKGIILAMDAERCVGFIIYEKSGQGLHLRYWWIAEDQRGKGIGSRLMDHFFEASEGTRRQFLWVFADNDNAIKRYRHYGFDFDGTQDDIYILKN